MRDALGLLVLVCLLGACSSKPAPAPQVGGRVVYHGGAFAVFTICDRGNRVYLTETGSSVTVIPGGCPSGEP